MSMDSFYDSQVACTLQDGHHSCGLWWATALKEAQSSKAPISYTHFQISRRSTGVAAVELMLCLAVTHNETDRAPVSRQEVFNYWSAVWVTVGGLPV